MTLLAGQSVVMRSGSNRWSCVPESAGRWVSKIDTILRQLKERNSTSLVCSFYWSQCYITACLLISILCHCFKYSISQYEIVFAGSWIWCALAQACVDNLHKKRGTAVACSLQTLSLWKLTGDSGVCLLYSVRGSHDIAILCRLKTACSVDPAGGVILAHSFIFLCSVIRIRRHDTAPLLVQASNCMVTGKKLCVLRLILMLSIVNLCQYYTYEVKLNSFFGFTSAQSCIFKLVWKHWTRIIRIIMVFEHFLVSLGTLIETSSSVVRFSEQARRICKHLRKFR